MTGTMNGLIPPQGGSGTAPSLKNGMTINERDQLLQRHLDDLNDLVANALTSRQEWIRQQMDTRKDVFKECGFPLNPSARDYQLIFDRDSIGARVVEVLPKEAWQTQPLVYEDEDGDDPTELEQAWDDLGKSLRGEQSWYKEEKGSPVWDELLQLDVLAGIGHYGILLIGFDDGRQLSEPVEGLNEDGSFPVGKEVDKEGKETGKITGNAWTKGKARYKSTWKNKPITENIAPFYPTHDRNDLAPYPKSEGNRFEPINDNPSEEQYPPDPGEDEGEQQAEGTGLKVLYLRAFPEAQAYVSQWETNPSSPRVRHPVSYLVTFDDQSQLETFGLSAGSTQQVHWSRVIHLADTYHQASSGKTAAPPRLKPVLNEVLSAQKIRGADGEGFWKMGLPGLAFETHPNLGTSVKLNREQAKDTMEQYQEGLQKVLLGIGGTYKTMAPSMIDPTPHLAAQIEAICIKIGCPIRVFKGSERGELASSQDDAAWNDRLRHRQQFFMTPRIIVPFVDRLIACGVLPEPVDGYCIEWPDLDSQTATEKATVANTRTTAMAAYVGGQVETLMTPFNFLTRVMYFSEEEVEAILADAEKAMVEKEEEAALKAEEMGLEVAPPPGTIDPAQQEEQNKIAMAAAKSGGKPGGFPPKGGPPQGPGGEPPGKPGGNPFAKKGGF